uniref:Uncharacterized protein n=1 Tax=Oryza barthii TaxID=65489 RepID=A0A0D3HSG4_9ORYZ
MASSVLVFAGKSVASPTISFFANKAFNYLQNQYRKAQGIEDMKIRLQRNIPKIQSVIDIIDTDYIKESSEDLDTWLWQLRDAVEEAEDVIDELEYYELKEKEKDQKVSHQGSSFTKMKRKCLQSIKHISVFGKTSDCPLKRLKNAMGGLDEAVKGVDNFLALVDQIKRTTLDNSQRVDEMNRTNMAFSVLVFAGKTVATPAISLLVNKLRDTVEEAEDAIDELEYYKLKEKEKDQKVSHQGSSFTKMKSKCFQSVKHISVFSKTFDCPLKRLKDACGSYLDPKEFEDIREAGEKITKKLRGCPLVTKVIAGHLREHMTVQFWDRFLHEHLGYFDGRMENIMKVLKLSYFHLPPGAQVCFRYCSIFPQNHEFKKGELVQMWIASGLIPQTTGEAKRAQDVGEEYLIQLTRKSFVDLKLRNFHFGRNEGHEYYVMHNLIYDLATWVSSSECARIAYVNGSERVKRTLCHLSVVGINSFPVEAIKSFCQFKYLRTIIFEDSHDIQDDAVRAVEEVLESLKALRVVQCKVQ